MDQIYQVVKNEQEYSEIYYSSYQKIISHHKTPSGARIKVLDKIDEELRLLEERRKRNTHFDEKYWITEEQNIKSNKVFIAVGMGSETEVTPYTLFEIVTIKLED